MNGDFETLKAEVRQLRAEFEHFKTWTTTAFQQQTAPQLNLGPLQERIEKLEQEMRDTREWVKNMRSSS